MTGIDPSKCYNRAKAGAMLGGALGVMWGTVDAYRATSRKGTGDSLMTRLRTDAATRRFFLRHQFVGIGVITTWSMLFQSGRCLFEQKRLPEFETTLAAYLFSVAPFIPIREARRHFPATLMFTAFDVYHRMTHKYD